MLLSQHVYQALIDHTSHMTGNILEIGAFEGEGTARLARHWPTTKIYVVDPFVEDGHTTAATQVDRGQVMNTQRAAFERNVTGLDNVRLYEVTSRAFGELSHALPDMHIDRVIIDGSHHYEDVILDSEIAWICIKDRGGVIVFDDLAIADVSKALAEFESAHADRIRKRVDIYGVAALLEIGHVN